MALIIRRRGDGTIEAETDLPDSHEFGGRWIAGAVSRGIADVTLTINLTEGPVTYRLDGYVEDEGGKVDYKRMRFVRG